MARESISATLRKVVRPLLGIDDRALAVMRISAGCIVLLDLVSRARFLAAHYTGEGVITRELILAGDYSHLSLHLLNDSIFYQGVLFIIAGIAALMMLLGWKTRLATIATWVLLVSLHARNPFVIFHGDIELRVLLFFAMFLPWGRRFSLDAHLARAARVVRDHLVVSVASAALLLQVAYIYLFAATEKSGPEWRVEGSAVYLALSNSHFGSSVGHALTAYPELLMFLTFGVLWLQQLSFLLLFFPVRTYFVRGCAVALLLLMQTGFALAMNLSFFPLISITALLAFVPPTWWDWLERRFTKHV